MSWPNIMKENVDKLLTLSESDEQLNLVIKLMTKAGLKTSEILEISVKDVKPLQNSIRVYNQENDSYARNLKTQTSRKIPIELMNDIMNYISKNKVNGKLIDKSGELIANKLKLYGKQAGFKLTPAMLTRYYYDQHPEKARQIKTCNKKIRIKSIKTSGDVETAHTRENTLKEASAIEPIDVPPIRHIPEIVSVIRTLEGRNKDEAWAFIYAKMPKLKEYRSNGYEALVKIYPKMYNKEKGWDDIRTLMYLYPADIKEFIILFKAIFPYVNDKIIAWNDIKAWMDEKIQGSDVYIEFIQILLPDLPYNADKSNIWTSTYNTIKKKITYEPRFLEYKTSYFEKLRFIYPFIPNKTQAYNDIIGLLGLEKDYINYDVIKLISDVYQYVPDQQAAWKDVYNYLKSEYETNNHNRLQALSQYYGDIILSSYKQVPDKHAAWDDIYRLLQYKYWTNYTIELLFDVFWYVPDKQKAWRDIFRYIYNNKVSEIGYAWDKLTRLKYVSLTKKDQIPDMSEAWNDLVRAMKTGDKSIQYQCSQQFEFIIGNLTNKTDVLSTLIELVTSENCHVQEEIYRKIKLIFSDGIFNQQSTWELLFKLSQERTGEQKSKITDLMLSTANQAQDKKAVWDALYQTARDEMCYKRFKVIETLFTMLLHMPNKQAAWDDLYRLSLIMKNEEQLMMIKILILKLPFISENYRFQQQLVTLSKNISIINETLTNLQEKTTDLP